MKQSLLSISKGEHIARLKKSVHDWNDWRVKYPEIAVNLSNADLSKTDLSNADLSKADLSYANLIQADLSNADLSNADLSKANFGAADLGAADLSGANLKWMNLSQANLEGANLSGAELTCADLIGTYLMRANLTGADLSWANLTEADLGGANLREVSLYETIFGNTKLIDVAGLDTCQHRGPSILEHRTLERSGTLPQAFLRGCGLSELLIDYLPTMLSQPIQYYSCFISYNHTDQTFARRLHDQLQGKGIRCWLDEHQVLPGDDIYEQVDRGIKLWDKVLLCCSEASLTSWWVDNEINSTFEKERKLMKDRSEKVMALIPLNLDGYLFGGHWKSGKADAVRIRMAADFTGWKNDNDKFEKAFNLLVKALTTGNQGREPAPKSMI